MTDHEGRTPSAWTVCARCGAVSTDRDQHEADHHATDERIAAIEQALTELTAPVVAPLTDDEGLL